MANPYPTFIIESERRLPSEWAAFCLNIIGWKLMQYKTQLFFTLHN